MGNEQLSHEKIQSEIAKLMAETANLNAETSKFTAERLKIFVVIAFYPFGIFAAWGAYFKYFA